MKTMKNNLDTYDMMGISSIRNDKRKNFLKSSLTLEKSDFDRNLFDIYKFIPSSKGIEILSNPKRISNFKSVQNQFNFKALNN